MEKLSPSIYLFFKNTGASWVNGRGYGRVPFQCFRCPFGVPGLEGRHMDKQLLLEVQQNKRTRGRGQPDLQASIGGAETLVNVLIDDVRLVQNQGHAQQEWNLPMGFMTLMSSGLFVEIHVPNLKIHAFFKQDKTASVEKGQVVPEYNTIIVTDSSKTKRVGHQPAPLQSEISKETWLITTLFT